jgi:hypothetical protein
MPDSLFWYLIGHEAHLHQVMQVYSCKANCATGITLHSVRSHFYFISLNIQHRLLKRVSDKKKVTDRDGICISFSAFFVHRVYFEKIMEALLDLHVYLLMYLFTCLFIYGLFKDVIS